MAKAKPLLLDDGRTRCAWCNIFILKMLRGGIIASDLLLANPAYATDCLTQFQPLFVNYQANLVFQSSTPNAYWVRLPSGTTSKQCQTTFAELQQYLKQQYMHAAKTQAEIKLGWNYMSLHDKVVYDFMAGINPQKLKVDYADFSSDYPQGYFVSNQAKYLPISSFNDMYGCFSFSSFTLVSGAAHPDKQIGLACNLAGTGTAINLAQLVNEKEIVSKMLNTPYFKHALAKSTIRLTKIKSFDQLQQVIEQVDNDELSCFASTLNMQDTSFVLTSLNANGSINLRLGLNSDIGACSQVYREVDVSDLKSKFKISKFIAAGDF